MMLATRQVAKNLHKRFNEQKEILEGHTGILKELVSSLKEMSSSQNKNHLEMINVLKKIENKL